MKKPQNRRRWLIVAAIIAIIMLVVLALPPDSRQALRQLLGALAKLTCVSLLVVIVLASAARVIFRNNKEFVTAFDAVGRSLGLVGQGVWYQSGNFLRAVWGGLGPLLGLAFKIAILLGAFLAAAVVWVVIKTPSPDPPTATTLVPSVGPATPISACIGDTYCTAVPSPPSPTWPMTATASAPPTATSSPPPPTNTIPTAAIPTAATTCESHPCAVEPLEPPTCLNGQLGAGTGEVDNIRATFASDNETIILFERSVYTESGAIAEQSVVMRDGDCISFAANADGWRFIPHDAAVNDAKQLMVFGEMSNGEAMSAAVWQDGWREPEISRWHYSLCDEDKGYSSIKAASEDGRAFVMNCYQADLVSSFLIQKGAAPGNEEVVPLIDWEACYASPNVYSFDVSDDDAIVVGRCVNDNYLSLPFRWSLWDFAAGSSDLLDDLLEPCPFDVNVQPDQPWAWFYTERLVNIAYAASLYGDYITLRPRPQPANTDVAAINCGAGPYLKEGEFWYGLNDRGGLANDLLNDGQTLSAITDMAVDEAGAIWITGIGREFDGDLFVWTLTLQGP